ncbi:MAG: hypothetical protein PF495_06735, partial [Spirochaetales bacterium]|nr:hypothetical protein [Spirochaetales bacterium]
WETVMKKLLGVILLLSISLSLFASEAVSISPNQAVVYLKGVIVSKSTTITAYDEYGTELDQDTAILAFDFPATEVWEVSKSIHFKYTSNLSTGTYGRLSFSISDLQLNEANTLRTSLELASEHLMTRVEGGNTFSITFLPGTQNDREIGKLTIKVNKEANDLFTAGSYKGSFSVNYTDGL